MLQEGLTEAMRTRAKLLRKSVLKGRTKLLFVCFSPGNFTVLTLLCMGVRLGNIR